MPFFRHGQFFHPALRWLFLAALAAQAHDTIIYDPASAAQYSANGTWTSAAPVTLHALAMARLRRDDLQIELTLADGAAFKLLDADPFVAPADSANASATVSTQHFSQDQALLTQRGANLLVINNNGSPLKVLAVNVEPVTGGEIVFRLTYPPAIPGNLSFHPTYLGKIPTGQKDLLTVMDSSERTLGSTTLSQENPEFSVTVPAPSAGVAPVWRKVAEAIGGVAVVAVLLVLLQKLSHRQQEK